jgi:CRISPR/Cas system CSM-associated protein Csm3 (group 7 of RAMP superfamily)
MTREVEVIRMENRDTNSIEKVIYIKGKLKLLSPLLVGNGEREFTNNDLIKDTNGNSFIPGTSIAGSVRNHIKEILNRDEELIDILFGGEEVGSNQSLLYFYDSTLTKKGTISMRDGIAVNNFIKAANTKEYAKYDYQILERDNEFDFRLELCLRNSFKDKEKDILKILSIIISELVKGNIYIGAKKNRGLGNIKLMSIEILKFDFDKSEIKENLLKEFLEFSWDKKFLKVSKEAFASGNEFMDLVKKCENMNINTHIKVPLKVRDTIFIRNYIVKSTDVDAEQLDYNGRLIVPGTTWAGAIRHRMFIILYDLGLTEKQAKEKIEELFGYVNKNKKAKASRIRFRDSIDSNKSKFVNISRTKIDRFTGGACSKALFEERVAVNGDISLDIYIKDQKQWEMGLLILSIYDLMSGMLAIGGETSVGRGLVVAEDGFSIKKELILIDGQPLCKEDEKKYFKALKEEISSFESV